MKMATINVRIPEELKRNGDRVLQRKGISTSDVVRGLYSAMDSEQDVPPWVLYAEGDEGDVFEKRRRLVRQLAGVAPLPSGYDLDDIKSERLAWLINDEERNESVL